LCGDNVRFVLRYLKEKHPETLKDTDVIKLNMSRIKKNFSDNSYSSYHYSRLLQYTLLYS
jgi:transposase